MTDHLDNPSLDAAQSIGALCTRLGIDTIGFVDLLHEYDLHLLHEYDLHILSGSTLGNALLVLNRINEEDPSVLPSLIEYRVPCNIKVEEDPTVQVSKIDDQYMVGILGILNGIFGINSKGVGLITAVFNDNGKIDEFVWNK